MLFGLRVTALIPVALSLMVAGALLDTSPTGTQTALIGVAVLASVACVALGVAHYFAEHPLEQNPTPYRQGREFERAHLGDAVHTENLRTEAREERSAPEVGRSAEEIRDRMLERVGGMTAGTRGKLLGQRWFRYWERQMPPALYFDSAEAPAVFLGLDSETGRGKLEPSIDDLLDNGRA